MTHKEMVTSFVRVWLRGLKAVFALSVIVLLFAGPVVAADYTGNPWYLLFYLVTLYLGY